MPCLTGGPKLKIMKPILIKGSNPRHKHKWIWQEFRDNPMNKYDILALYTCATCPTAKKVIVESND